MARIVGEGGKLASGQIPFTPRGKKVLELASKEAHSLGHDYIGTGHLLLGIARENQGVAARILLDLDADAESVRGATVPLLAKEPREGELSLPPPGECRRITISVSRTPGGRFDRFVTCAGQNVALIGGVIVFGTGLLVGWLIWG